MRVEVVKMEPEFMLSLTRADLEFVRSAAETHYDGSVRGLTRGSGALSGPFLFGNPKPSLKDEIRLYFRRGHLDLMAKALENLPAGDERAYALYSFFSKILRSGARGAFLCKEDGAYFEGMSGVGPAPAPDMQKPALTWQPIATAPRDGTAVLVYANPADVAIVRLASWDNGEHWQMNGFDSQAEARGWWSYENSVSQERLEGYYLPTHWMPCPELPK